MVKGEEGYLFGEETSEWVSKFLKPCIGDLSSPCSRVAIFSGGH
jgi:hypothetical protein